MKKIPFILLILLIIFALLQCNKKEKPDGLDTTNPKYWFPIGQTYNWLYARLGPDCIATGDTFSITNTSKSDRYIDGISYSGWDMVSSPGGDTSFYYQVADTIFFKKDPLLSLPPYHILVGPVEAGKFWKDRSPYNYDYSIVGFEDLYSSAAGITYANCVKIKRTSPDDNKSKYYWWSSEYGKVREVDYQAEQCLGGEELKYLDKSHTPP
jgi:hypothetical protein